jgi:hypothetical protein
MQKVVQINKIASQKILSSRLSEPRLEKVVMGQTPRMDHCQSQKALPNVRFDAGETNIGEAEYDRIVNQPKFRIHNFCRYDLDKVKATMFGNAGEKGRQRQSLNF